MCVHVYLYISDFGGNSSRTGWRRLIGSPKLRIIFHKRATKYMSLLRKMTYKDEGSYESSPPCNTSYLVLAAPGRISQNSAHASI